MKPLRNWRCVLFGHKFNHNTLDYLRGTTDFCTRCGLRPWRPTADTNSDGKGSK